MEYPKTSVVIGSFNRRRLLELCVNAVREELSNTNFEIIVVDGGSNDGATEWLVAQKDIITIIQHNRGEWNGKQIPRKPWAYFMNLAFKAASGKYICMISDDSLIVPGAIKNGVDLFDKSLARGEKLGGVAFYFRDYPIRKEYAVAINVGNLYVNHGLYLNAAMREVGYIDESYHFYFADTDLCLKLKAAGYDIVSSKASFVEHYFDATPEIRATNNDGKKDKDRAQLIERWKGKAFPENQESDYIKLVGYWEHHPQQFVDAYDTIGKLVLASQASEPVKAVLTSPAQPKRPLLVPTLPKNDQGAVRGQERTALRDILASEESKKILFADLYALRGKTTKEKRKILKIWQRNFVMTDFILPKVKDGDALFFRSLVRDDYKNMFHTVINASGLKNPIIVEDYKIRKNKLNLRASRFLVDHMDLSNTLDISCPIDRSCAFIRLVQYGFVLEHFKHAKLRVLVCHADMQPVEHLLAWYFRSKGVPTITMQHGLYVDYENYDTVNKINYLHHASEYFLSWGGDTEKLIHKYHSGANVIICGKPLVTVSEKCNIEASEKVTDGYCTVIFDQKIFDEENILMLRLASEYAKKYKIGVKVKFHPQNNRGKFRSLGIKFDENFDIMKSKFILGHTSSLLYEMMGRGMKVFKYRSKVPCLPTPAQITISNLNDLETSINSKFDYEDQFSKYISYTGSDSLDRYRKVFESIVVEKQA